MSWEKAVGAGEAGEWDVPKRGIATLTDPTVNPEGDMVVRFLTTKLVPAATTLGVAVTVYCSNAAAFFPPILGSDPPVVVVPPPVAPVVPVVPPVIPPVVPPPFVPPPVVVPPVNPPVVPSDRCPTPSEIPEPATVATALIGLAAFGAAGVRKAMKKKDQSKG